MMEQFKLLFAFVEDGSEIDQIMKFERDVTEALTVQQMTLWGWPFAVPIREGKAIICQAAMHNQQMEDLMRSLQQENPLLANLDNELRRVMEDPGRPVPGGD